MSKVHLVYPDGPSISSPQAIGRNVAARLRQHYEVVQCDWTDTHVLHPERGDVLVGHPHPEPRTVFRRSIGQPGWRRIIMMTPYTHDPRQMAYCDAVLPHCDLYLAVTGGFWFESVQQSLFKHWRPKMVHVDLAVDRADFPVVKKRFNRPGSRRILYIGHDGWQKNPRYLEQIARLLPASTISWMGLGRRIEGLARLGHQDFATDASRRLVAGHDFVLTVGRFDANPTTILEAMAWGLVPVCTPTSGYDGYAGIVNVPVDDPGEAAMVLERLQHAPEDQLLELQQRNWHALDSHLNWDRFSDQVLAAIRSDKSPPLLREGLGRRLRLRATAMSSPNHKTNVPARTIARASRVLERALRARLR